MSPEGQKVMRKLDVVTVKGSEVPIGIYTYDALQDQVFKDDKKGRNGNSGLSSHGSGIGNGVINGSGGDNNGNVGVGGRRGSIFGSNIIGNVVSGYSSVDRNSPVNTRSANNTPTTPTSSNKCNNAKYVLHQNSSPNDSPVISAKSGVKSGITGSGGMGGAGSSFTGMAGYDGTSGAGSYNGTSSGSGLHSVSMSGGAMLCGADDSARDDIGLGKCMWLL